MSMILGRFEIWSGMPNPAPDPILSNIYLSHSQISGCYHYTNQRYIGTLFSWRTVDLCDFLPRRLLPLPRGLKAPPVHPWFYASIPYAFSHCVWYTTKATVIFWQSINALTANHFIIDLGSYKFWWCLWNRSTKSCCKVLQWNLNLSEAFSW